MRSSCDLRFVVHNVAHPTTEETQPILPCALPGSVRKGILSFNCLSHC